MMMERPRPQEETKTPPPAVSTKTKKKSSSEAVEDLERRLAMLGGTTTSSTPPGAVSTDDEEDSSGAVPAASVASKPAPTEPSLLAQTANTTAVKGGKNALLARIMAAQERAKKAQEHHTEPSAEAPPDLLSAPSPAQEAPPAFDAVDLPPPATQKDEPPPPFEAVQDTVMEQVQATTSPVTPVLAPSAPAFEDLLDSQAAAAPPLAQDSNPLEGMQMVQPPAEDGSSPEDVWGGLSEDERKALMDEQRQIMEAIEQEKAANAAAIAAAQAENFEQRGGEPAAAAPVTEEAASGAQRMVNLGGDQTVALHGQERTRAAIAAGTAILVQCINCMNWMQVTDNATLMYCPVCSVVSPVIKQDAVMTREEAMQLTNDRRIAEQMQNEEYKEAEGEEEEESWWDSITSVFTGSGKKAEQAVAVTTHQPSPAALQRGEMGVSRPPGSAPAATLSPAHTGEEENNESEGLLGSGKSSQLPAARVAERQPLFSCVVDSVSSAASTIIGTSQTLHEDPEGNIHGVDASSLLSVTRASRDNQYEQLANEEN